jgi:hypothetical protein
MLLNLAACAVAAAAKCVVDVCQSFGRHLTDGLGAMSTPVELENGKAAQLRTAPFPAPEFAAILRQLAESFAHLFKGEDRVVFAVLLDLYLTQLVSEVFGA